MVDPFEAVKIISEAGYDALEICASEEWPSSPTIFSTDQQEQLVKLVQDLGFPSPIIFGNIDV